MQLGWPMHFAGLNPNKIGWKVTSVNTKHNEAINHYHKKQNDAVPREGVLHDIQSEMGMVTQKKKKIEILFKSIILIEQNLQVEIFLKRKESQYKSK